MKTNKSCKEFKEIFPELFLEPDENLWIEWQSHQKFCEKCQLEYKKTTEEQQLAQNAVDQLIKFVPLPHHSKPKNYLHWRKYLTAAVVILLISLNFYLTNSSTLSMEEKISQLVKDYVEGVDSQKKITHLLMDYGENFHREYSKLEILATSYQELLDENFILLVKMRLLINCRAYTGLLNKETLEELVNSENNLEKVKKTFSRAIYNISIDEKSEYAIADFFQKALPHLLNLRIKRDFLLDKINREYPENLHLQKRLEYIFWKTEQYFIQ